MTLRERIETVFRGGTPDAMVFFADLTYWHGAHSQIGDLPEAWRGPRGIGRLHRDLGAGEYVPGCCAYTTQEGDGVRTEEDHAPSEHIRRIITPVGTLTERREYSAPSFSWGITEHLVKEAADLRILRYIMEQRSYRPCPERIAEIDRDYGDFGLPIVAVPGSPLTELNKSWAGIMGMCYLLADAPAEVQKTLDAIAESQSRLYDITAACNCNYVMVCENLTGETMGGYFNEYLAPYLARRTDHLHRHGKKVIIHIDGTLRGVLEKIAGTGIDCVDAITPAPVGDVPVTELRHLAGDRLLILGGLPGAMFAPPFTAKDMERHVRDIIHCHKDSGRFMLGVADQVPPDGDIYLVRLVRDLLETEGRYG